MEKRKNKIYIVIVILLIGLAFWFYRSQQICTIDEFPCQPDKSDSEIPNRPDRVLYPDGPACEGSQCEKG
jgi:hypothetical protein